MMYLFASKAGFSYAATNGPGFPAFFGRCHGSSGLSGGCALGCLSGLPLNFSGMSFGSSLSSSISSSSLGNLLLLGGGYLSCFPLSSSLLCSRNLSISCGGGFSEYLISFYISSGSGSLGSLHSSLSISLGFSESLVGSSLGFCGSLLSSSNLSSCMLLCIGDCSVSVNMCIMIGLFSSSYCCKSTVMYLSICNIGSLLGSSCGLGSSDLGSLSSMNVLLISAHFILTLMAFWCIVNTTISNTVPFPCILWEPFSLLILFFMGKSDCG